MDRRCSKIEEMSTADLGFSLEEVRGRRSDEVARMGAKLVLEVAMAEEVTEFPGRSRYDCADADRPGCRNGKRTRRVQIGSGPVELDAAKVTGALLPFSSEVLPARDLGDCLTFHSFPEMHWKRLRTSNVIERAFREVRRRKNVVGRFSREATALKFTWATLEQDRLKGRGVQMDEDILKTVAKIRKEGALQEIDPSVLDAYLEAA